MLDQATAQKRGEALAATMGEGWRAQVWENLGWHYTARKGFVTIYPNEYQDGSLSYSAWIEPGVTLGNTVLQIIERGSTPQEALGLAKQVAWDTISRIRGAITDLEADISN